MDFDYKTEDEDNYSPDGEPIPGAIEYLQQRYAAAVTRCTEDASDSTADGVQQHVGGNLGERASGAEAGMRGH